jgi:DNA ligase-1
MLYHDHHMTEFLELSLLLDKISDIASRNEKIRLVGEFLLNLQNNEVGFAALFISGRVFPENDPRVLSISWKGIMKVLRESLGITWEELEKVYEGDTGEAVARVLDSEDIKRQTTLFSEPLSISLVGRKFDKIALTTGKGSKKEKENILMHLFVEASPREAKYLVALLLGDMRTGVSEGLVAESIANAFNIKSSLVRRAWQFCGDLGKVASIATEEGSKGLAAISIELMRPVKPMLATPADDIQEIIKLNEHIAFELKFDGARVQVHKNDDNVKIYSRRLSDVTESLPEIVDIVTKEIQVKRFILDGEVVAIDEKGVPYPFQVVMQRFGRVKDIHAKQQEISLLLYVFDILLLNNEQFVDLSYHERRSKLIDILPKHLITECRITDDEQEALEFFEQSRELGHEGLVAKRLESKYTPGVRGKNWFKIKHTLELFDMAIIAAEWGYGRRSGWLSDYHLGVRNEETGEFVMVGKTFKGLTDAQFQEITQKLLELETGRDRGIVHVKPEIIVEVLASEIQDSPRYKSGMALRFARITRICYDKGPEDTTTVGELRTTYAEQFKYKAR